MAVLRAIELGLMITIRPATPADVPLMLELIRGLAEYERVPDAVRIGEADLLRDGFGKTPFFECFIAENDQIPAGFALFFPIYSTWQGPSLYLEDLFVKPEFRWLGLGKALLQRVAQEAAKRSCVRLEWSVLDWNQPAIDFYHSLGAVFLDEWTRMRVTGDALTALAASEVTA